MKCDRCGKELIGIPVQLTKHSGTVEALCWPCAFPVPVVTGTVSPEFIPLTVTGTGLFTAPRELVNRALRNESGPGIARLPPKPAPTSNLSEYIDDWDLLPDA